MRFARARGGKVPTMEIGDHPDRYARPQRKRAILGPAFVSGRLGLTHAGACPRGGWRGLARAGAGRRVRVFCYKLIGLS
jgi:hypothetical protein